MIQLHQCRVISPRTISCWWKIMLLGKNRERLVILLLFGVSNTGCLRQLLCFLRSSLSSNFLGNVMMILQFSMRTLWFVCGCFQVSFPTPMTFTSIKYAFDTSKVVGA
ncbi:hypothetical protein CsSME_00028525 [Camellia sinensis var. sinensis]